ncbi:MAG TPA: hypothetical protein VLA68_01390 [Nitrososphaera sp.]|nr:hypothetical protein [Nitrososphaera sp.]
MTSIRNGKALAAVAVLLGSIVAGMFFTRAEAVLISPEEHWKYEIWWYWDSDLRKNVGLITPTIVIENETSDRLEGYIADANGTRLTMYDGDQLVQVRYYYDYGMVSKWELAGWLDEGYFTIEIPEAHRDADVVRIHIGNHQYTVDNGTYSSPQSWVYVNTARLDYRTDPTLDNTEISEEEEAAPAVLKSPSWGSLIDLILSQHGLL